MFTFSQSLGRATDQDENYIGSGWSGNGEGVDNPDKQDVHNVGPLPRGRYRIGPAHNHPHLGPVVMDLIPAPGNQMFGRLAFRIHGAAQGDTFISPGHSSDGCIILPRPVRERIAASSDKDLQVIE